MIKQEDLNCPFLERLQELAQKAELLQFREAQLDEMKRQRDFARHEAYKYALKWAKSEGISLPDLPWGGSAGGVDKDGNW